MYIIDKNKDYYDYFSNIYGEDKNITFDRRGSVICHDEMFAENPRYREYLYGKFILLEVGTIQYLIRVFDIKYREIAHYEYYESSKMELEKVFKNNKNKFGEAISIRTVNVPRLFLSKKNKKFYDYDDYKPCSDIFIRFPILARTQITSLINPEEIWKELSNYISSLQNDKEQVYVPDIQKVVNHGFDKRESFRNIK